MDRETRLLVINDYFAPRSFGGATIVAEEVTRRLSAEYGWTVLVVTVIEERRLEPYAIRRYRNKGLDIIGINIPNVPPAGTHRSYIDTYDYDIVNEKIAMIADLFVPDVVHVHSTVTPGAGYLDALKKEGNAVLVVTAHDCWWICERQFMIASDGQYCFQDRIDPQRCAYCVSEPARYARRRAFLGRQLRGCDLLLFPSRFQKDLYERNGLAGMDCRVNKNGIRLPGPGFEKRRNDHVVFGFIGGPGPIKGADHIVKAFNAIGETDYELVVVDAAAQIGRSWRHRKFWEVPGQLSFRGPYAQGELDEFFSGIDVLLFPSQWKESFGLTVREALVRDVWVVATDAGGLVEDLEPGRNSTVIPIEGDYRPLQGAIEACLRRDWAGYTNPCTGRIRGVDEQARELDEFYREALIGRGHPTSLRSELTPATALDRSSGARAPE